LSPDIWYCYTPHCTGTATASLCGSSFDTMLAVYGGCTCPTSPSALDCQDDNCGGSSQISFSVSACESYLVRVGGYNGLVGVGTLSLSCVPNSVVNDCDGNTIEDADDLACGTLLDNDHNGIPDVCEISGDSIVGGRLYDRWWSVTGDSAPTTDHPLWAFRPDPVSNGSTGAATWRCTECHGWDYKGVDGENASGPHRTGIPGIYGTAMTAFDLATLLREPPDNGGGPGVPNGHDYGSVLSSDHIDNLVAFVLGKVIDTDDYVNPVTHHFLGDPIAGQTHYNGGGTINQCVACHGANGAAINFGTPEEPEYLGTVAVFEPLHFLHRGRLGFPGTPMPGWLANGGTNQGAADIGRYAQLSLAVDCIDSAQCDDGVDCTINTCNGAGRCLYIEDNSLCPDDGLFCNGPQICDAALGCVGAGNPCWDAGSCDEDFDHCGCTTPLVIAAGQRYLAVTPQPSASNTAMRLIVTPNCPSGVSKYVGAPSGEFNVATLVADAEQAPRFTIAQWGQTVYVSGLDIVPEVEYLVRAECGVPGAPVETPQASATTGVWGDVAGDGFGPDGEVDALDIVGLVDAFKHADGAPSLFVADIFSCSPNQIIDAIDIVGCLDAYKHISYLMTSCPNPCR